MTVNLGAWRTPVEPAPRLSEAIGLNPGDLWVKRDDWLAHGGGGNKIRKLEYLIDHARDEGADVLVAYGAAQSNFARLAAACARRMGMGIVLVLRGDGPGRATGNLTLAGLFDAEVRWVGEAGGNDLREQAEIVAGDLRGRGETPYVLPYGGSDPIGARGYLDCAEELSEQASRGLDHVVVPVGSGGTMAGLVAGLGADRVIGVDSGAVPDAAARVAEMLDHLGEPTPADRLRLRGEQIGSGYGVLTEAAKRAMSLAATTQGLVLDPVYGAKAMAGLIAAVRERQVHPGDRTIYVHTGGLPGLFGHGISFDFASATRAAQPAAPED